MNLSKYYSGALCALLLVLLSACSTMGYVSPESPAQRLSYVDTQIAAVVNTLATEKQEGNLTQDQISKIDNLVKSWSRIRELAYASVDDNRPEDVLDYLQTLENILVQMKAMRNE